MELVYLWVEDYKNIEKQGFNFSPRFECDFKAEYEKYVDDNGEEKERLKDNCELEIKPKEHIENFFGENINVTAIVGKNGSGKSSVLEILDWILQTLYEEKNLIVYANSSSLYYISNINVDISKINIDIRNNDDMKNLKYYIYSSDIDCISLKKYDTKNKVLVDIFSIGNMISNSYIQVQKFELTTFMYVPFQMDVKLVDLDKKFIETYNSAYDEIYSDEIPFENEVEYTLTPEEDYEKQVNLPAKMDDFKRESEETYNEKKNLLNAFKNSEDNFHKFLLIKYIEEKIVVSDKELLKDANGLWNDCFSKYLISEDDFYRCFQTQKINISGLSKFEKNIYFSEYKEYFDLDFIDEKGRKFNNLSHGERIIFSQFINIYSHVLENQEENFIFLFDEPELSLHPSWQKKYLFELCNLFVKLNKNFHFLFTSHSPFLLSDIPKQNIIFLDKDEKGNCKVVDGLKEKKQTFGANIHTLLSDSFFMEDGLMGEFAKSKIDGVIKLLNKDKLSEDEIKHCEQIISIIGEPIVKNQLQQMLDSKRLKKVDEIDTIKKSMAEMQKRLDELEK